jgi:hypothetical protein
MTHVTFGYSRAEYTPRDCRLNPFPADREHQGKFPLFVDTIQADAIIVRLDPQRVWRWLEMNNLKMSLPKGATDAQKAQRAYFVQLFSDLVLQPEPVTLTQTLTANNSEARMVFGLLHTQYLRQNQKMANLVQFLIERPLYIVFRWQYLHNI